MKPMLARDYVREKLAFPIGMLPKIDGVRGLTIGGHMTGRSLKKLKNKYTTAFYSIPEYKDLDGELAAGLETDQDLCRKTTSAVATIEGSPFTLWHLFDCLHKHVINGPYQDRHAYLKQYVEHQQAQGRCMNARVVPLYIAENLEQLDWWNDHFLEQGYEGSIVRSLSAPHAQRRSSAVWAEFWRIKQFVDAEAMCIGIVEGDRNDNEAQTNELGRTFRSRHQENKVPNGMVGNLQCMLIEDLVYNGDVLFKAKDIITVSAGAMDHDMRRHYFENQGEILQKMMKFKFFPKGVKDKPRFATFLSIRDESDI